MPVVFLIVAVIGALFTVNAFRPLARAGPFSVGSFFAGWLTSELPVHHLVWQAGATAVFIVLGALRSWPGWVGLGITALSWVGLAFLIRAANQAGEIVERALVEALGPDYRSRIAPSLTDRIASPASRLLLLVPSLPWLVRNPQLKVTRNIAYGEHGRRNQLDVYRSRDEPIGSPVLVQVHGGGWVVGKKDQQAIPLMHHLASHGWVCVALNYRLSPKVAFPDQLIDVKRALAWVKEHIAEYGGNPDFVVITGGSAGGHLSSLAALTTNDPEYQPGFEDVDTSVQACVPFYGVYDFTNRNGVGRADMRIFLERVVLKRSMRTDPDAFDQASPMSRITDAAPPMFVVHGRNDSLVPVAEARLFVELLRTAARGPVAYAELPYAQHAFEVFPSIRTYHVVGGVERFVAVIYSDWLRHHEQAEVTANR